MQNLLLLAGRILIAAIFLMSGLRKLTSIAETKEHMASAGMPAVGFFLVCSIIFEVLGSLSLISGYKTKWGAWALVVFLIPATLIFHTNFSDPMQIGNFMKNLTTLGGLLILAAVGPGLYSLDAKKKAPTG